MVDTVDTEGIHGTRAITCLLCSRDGRGLYSTSALRVCAERAGLRVRSFFTTAKGAAWHWHAVLGGGAGKLRRTARKLEAVAVGLVGANLVRVGNLGEEVILIAER